MHRQLYFEVMPLILNFLVNIKTTYTLRMVVDVQMVLSSRLKLF